VKGGEVAGRGSPVAGEIVRLFDEGGFRLNPPASGFRVPAPSDPRPATRDEILVPENLVARRIWAGRIAAIQKYGEEKARKLYTVLWVSDEEWARLVYAAAKVTVKRLP
jgi:hypothetical protein